MPDAPIIIVNPTAGGGRAGRLLGWLRERLVHRPDARLVVTDAPGDAERWAADTTGRHDRVIAVGGDGTVQETVNGLLDGASGATLGIVPVGTGNDLARSLGLSGDPAVAWTSAIGERTAAVDVAAARRADGRTRWFASAGGVGFDAEVARAMAGRRGRQRGRTGYLATALMQLWGYRNRPVRVTLDGDEAIERSVLLVAVTNGAYYGGGMHIAPGAQVDDGMLDVCIVGDIGRLDALRQIPNLYRGRHVEHPAVELRRARVVELDGGPETLAHLDGEPFGELPIRIEVRPGALTVAVPLR